MLKFFFNQMFDRRLFYGKRGSVSQKSEVRGFTLLEIMLYITLTAIVLVSVIGIGQDLILVNVKTGAQREVVMNADLVMEQITQKIRPADGLLTSSVLNSHPGVLVLDYFDTSDVIFDTYTKDVVVGGNTITIRKLRIKEGTAAYHDLTNDNVNVTHFLVRKLSQESEPENIGVELTIQQLNPGNDADYNTSITLESAISLRR